jgi:hypothetical protein
MALNARRHYMTEKVSTMEQLRPKRVEAWLEVMLKN